MFPRQDHGRFSVTDDGTLIIEPVRKEDGGEYVCQALSVAGSAFAKARVQVKGTDGYWKTNLNNPLYQTLYILDKKNNKKNKKKPLYQTKIPKVTKIPNVFVLYLFAL